MTAYRTAVVTGASGGIGRATVTELVRLGLQVHALGLPDDSLEAMRGLDGVTVHAVDVRLTAELGSTLTGILESRVFIRECNCYPWVIVKNLKASEMDISAEAKRAVSALFGEPEEEIQKISELPGITPRLVEILEKDNIADIESLVALAPEQLEGRRGGRGPPTPHPAPRCVP